MLIGSTSSPEKEATDEYHTKLDSVHNRVGKGAGVFSISGEGAEFI